METILMKRQVDYSRDYLAINRELKKFSKQKQKIIIDYSLFRVLGRDGWWNNYGYALSDDLLKLPLKQIRDILK